MSAPPLIAVAHGSRDPAAAAAAYALVAQVRRLRPELIAICCFLEHAQPGLPVAITAVGTGAVVVPLLLTAAFHSATDLPTQLAAADPDGDPGRCPRPAPPPAGRPGAAARARWA